MPPTRVPSELVAQLNAGRFPWWFPKGAISGRLAFDYFAYGTDFVPLAASGTTTNPISINSDSAFLCLSACLTLTDTTNLIVLAFRPLLTMLSEAGGARNLFNTPQHVENIFGTAEEPKYLDVPKVWLPNSTVNVQMQNLDTVNARNVRVTFHGFKIFGFSQ